MVKKHKEQELTDLFDGSIWEKLPKEVRKWAESLPWNQRRYFLSLCHILCASPPDIQAEFLDDYTADGLVSKMLNDIYNSERVKEYLKGFRLTHDLPEDVMREYIRQFYIHSAQDVRRKPDQYLESALKLVFNSEEKNDVFNYILGFEFIKLMFKMSWLQHERLARLQKNQDEFIHDYVKPIQYAHRINGIIVPKDKDVFFAKRDYFVQIPEITERKLVALVLATFTTERVIACGFSIMRHSQSFRFDYDYIFCLELEESPFPWEFLSHQQKGHGSS